LERRLVRLDQATERLLVAAAGRLEQLGASPGVMLLSASSTHTQDL
jgi:hypothetical protein